MSANASIEVGVHEVLFAGKAPAVRSIKVKVKMPTDVVAMPLETPPATVSSASPTVGFSWAHKVPLQERGRSWVALQKALEHARVRPGAARIEFALLNAASSQELGVATLDLAALTGAAKEDPTQRLFARDARQQTVAEIVVRVRARDAVLLVAGGGTDAVDSDVRRAFAAFDADNSGDIDSHEVGATAPHRADDEAAAAATTLAAAVLPALDVSGA
jgi:hypothetical protein